jgi:hypothetical protein
MPAGRVPDLQGMFLRGQGGQASTHYGAVTHQSAALGQVQGDAIRNISGSWGHVYAHNPFGLSGAVYSQQSGQPSVNAGVNPWGTPQFFFNAARVVPTDNENRPVNIAVRYLIRATR